MRKRPAVGKCFAILYSDGQYRGDRWRNDVWGYVALSSQSSEKLSPELSADSFVWSFVCSASRYPSAAWLESLSRPRWTYILLNNIYIIFQLVLLFLIGLISIYDTFPASMLVAVFVSFLLLNSTWATLGPTIHLHQRREIAGSS